MKDVYDGCIAAMQKNWKRYTDNPGNNEIFYQCSIRDATLTELVFKIQVYADLLTIDEGFMYDVEHNKLLEELGM